MENSLVLYYIGKSHDSSKIILEQKKATENKKSQNFQGLLEIKESARQMKEDVLLGDFKGIANTLNAAWEAKKKTSKAISNKLIDDLHDYALSHGATAAKISGAGGGGVMMCWCEPEHKFELTEALRKLASDTNSSARVFTVDFVEKGAQVWKLYGED